VHFKEIGAHRQNAGKADQQGAQDHPFGALAFVLQDDAALRAFRSGLVLENDAALRALVGGLARGGCRRRRLGRGRSRGLRLLGRVCRYVEPKTIPAIAATV
jgi:hypothetical protein